MTSNVPVRISTTQLHSTPSLRGLGVHILLMVITFIAISPLIWMYLGSFKPFNELVRNPPTLWPENPTLDNFRIILFQVNFIRGFINSSEVAITTTLATLITSSAAGYVFAKYRFWGKEILFLLFLSTMMIPFAVVMVPLYFTISNLGMLDSLLGLIVTGLCSTFGIFMMRQFMETIPGELLDAARIDGASELHIFSRVVLPLSGAPLAALGVFVFMGQWDSFLWPLVVLNSTELMTLPLLLNSLQSLYWTAYELWVAGSVVTITPILVFYALAQRQFVRGIALSGLKA